MGSGQLLMILIVTLLILGSASLLTTFFLRFGAFCLLLFQIPTTILFEDGWYEQLSSTSICGGVLVALTLFEVEKE